MNEDTKRRNYKIIRKYDKKYCGNGTTNYESKLMWDLFKRRMFESGYLVILEDGGKEDEG